MAGRYHIDGTQEFGYSTIKRYLYSLYTYENIVRQVCDIHKDASVKSLKGYAAYFCYVRLQSFKTFLRVTAEIRDHVSALCILRMLGDCVANFHLIYCEHNEDYRLIRHCLYVIDGCEDSLDVLPENVDSHKDCLPTDEFELFKEEVRSNRQDRMRKISEAEEMLEQSPLKDEDAFKQIVEDRNWKFKEFKTYSKINQNQYKWQEMYERIECTKEIDSFSFYSQYVHGLSMSNLVTVPDQASIDRVLGDAVGLLDRMCRYTIDYFKEENFHIYAGFLEPATRDRILSCFDDEHRESIQDWCFRIYQKLDEIMPIEVRYTIRQME